MTTNRALRIALISTDYPPLCTSAAVQMRDLAVEMLKQGHEPVVIIPRSNLDATWKVEVMDNIPVLSLAVFRARDTNYFWRTFSELSLSFLMAYKLRKSPFKNTRWDLVVWYSPTIFFGPFIYFLKKKTKCRTYLILRDIFPEWAFDLGLIRNGLIYSFFKQIANIQYAVADSIGVQTSSNLVYLESFAKKYKKRLEVLHNWQAQTSNIGSSIDISHTSLRDRKIIVYIGNMGVAQGMDILIDLAEKLQDRNDLGFIFVGRGSELKRFKDRVTLQNITNTLFFDEIDSCEIPGLLSQCYLGLLALDPRHKTHNIPGKFLTYLIAGLPVLARVNPGTDLVYLINDTGVGRAYDSSSIPLFRQFIEKLIDNPEDHHLMSIRAKALAKKLFSPTQAVQQIIKSIDMSGN